MGKQTVFDKKERQRFITCPLFVHLSASRISLRPDNRSLRSISSSDYRVTRLSPEDFASIYHIPAPCPSCSTRSATTTRFFPVAAELIADASTTTLLLLESSPQTSSSRNSPMLTPSLLTFPDSARRTSSSRSITACSPLQPRRKWRLSRLKEGMMGSLSHQAAAQRGPSDILSSCQRTWMSRASVPTWTGVF